MPNPTPPARRVGLNAHLLSLSQTYRGAGINGYIYQLLQHLVHTVSPSASDAVDLHYVAYLHDRAVETRPGLSVCQSRWDTRRPWRRIIWEQTRLAHASRSLDLLHGMAYAAPLVAACPTIITVHDLSFVRFPDAFRALNRHYLRLITQVSSHRAAKVIAVSNSTRDDLVRLFGLPADRVVTVPNGVTSQFCPSTADESAAFRRRKGLPERFILFVGTIEPRKNLVRLLEAFALLSRANRTQLKLVIAGGKGWYYDHVFRRVTDLGLTESVIFPGFVPVAELPWWYRSATLFVYPSLFEGFGLPVLEAMACGTPTITSATSSLPEVAGDAALLVDPYDVAKMAEAISRVLSDSEFARDLGAAGIRQAAKFSWRRTAAETINVYRSVLQGCG